LRSTTAKNGHPQVGGDDEHPADVADLGPRLDLGADHEAGRVDQRDERQAVRIAELHEAGRLVGRIGVDRAAEVGRIAREQADRPSFDADQRGQDPDAEAGAQFEQRVGVADSSHQRAHVVDADAVLGQRVGATAADRPRSRSATSPGRTRGSAARRELRRPRPRPRYRSRR
jgi:hypothetical protein